METNPLKTIKKAVQEIAIRSEQEPHAINTFYDCNIISHLININHQIIQGRRGTGKTHILNVLRSELESDNKHCIYYDCKATGSAAEISDKLLPENHRAVQLMRDFLLFIHKDLLKFYNESFYKEENEVQQEIRDLMEQLHDECYTIGNAIQKFEYGLDNKSKRTNATGNNGKFSFANMLSASYEWFGNKQQERESEKTSNFSGNLYAKVVFPNVYQCIDRLAELLEKKFVILIDEWSNLPMDIQPHFAEFLRRCLMPSRNVIIKIAVVKGRTNYCLRENHSVIYGFEVGADISVTMDLDNVYMYDRNPERVTNNLFYILYTHLKAKGAVDGLDVSDLVTTLLYDRKCVFLLARASEGNPRDFISIVNSCIVELSSNLNAQIDSQTIYNAAKSWYCLDKEDALPAEHKQVLSELVSYVVYKKKTRGFVMEESYLKNAAIKFLIDARILHVVYTGRHLFPAGREPMAILVLDFGTYSDYLMMGQDIFFLTNDKYEKILFPNHTPSNYSDKLYPFDEKRQFQMCYLNPKLSPNICPSLLEFK